jgi:hypothetical protein
MQLDPTELKLLGNSQRDFFVPGEDPADFQALLSSLVTEYQPTTIRHQALVEDAALAQWILWRRNRSIFLQESNLHGEFRDFLDWNLDRFHLLRHMQQFRALAELTCARAFARLDAMRRQQIADQRWQMNYELRKAHLELSQRKYDDRCASRPQPQPTPPSLT